MAERKKLPVPEIPDFSVGIEEIQPDDPVHNVQMNAILLRLATNDSYLEKIMNRVEGTKKVSLTAVGWSGAAAPYIQTVPVPGATAESEAVLVSALADGASAATQRAYSKAFGLISSGTAALGDGIATFKVYKKPDTDCVVGLKGV